MSTPRCGKIANGILNTTPIISTLAIKDQLSELIRRAFSVCK